MGELAAHVAHDLKAPLASLNAATTLLEQGADHATIVELFQLSTKRLTGIAEDLLNNYSKTKTKPEPFILHPVLDELVREYQAQEKFANVAFIRQYETEPVTLFGVRPKLQRAFGNIIKNAIEAMECRGKIVLGIQRNCKNVTVAISDTGPGMTAELLAKVMSGGYTYGKADGHGIGTLVVKKVVEEFQGELKVESIHGKGTTFYVALPIYQQSQ